MGRAPRLLLDIAVFTLASESGAHDSWISRGGYRNQAGERCCGDGDCFVVRGVHAVTLPTVGYRLPGGEFVPRSEALPSPDGRFWRCRRPDDSRRCFFVPRGDV